MGQGCDFTPKFGQFSRLKVVKFNFTVYTISNISAGELSQLSAEISKIIKTFQETDLTLILTSDQPVVLHLHGYDIIAKVPKSGKALMKLNTFATGRFPIKMHLSAEDHQGNAQHERTLLYLEVHPN